MFETTRRWPRVGLALNVTLRAADAEEAAQTLNVSREGLYVRTSVPRPVGTPVTVTITLGTGERFQAAGVVVHIHPDPDDPTRAGADRPPGLGVFLTTTTTGWRDFCERVERTKRDAGGGRKDG